MVGRRPLAGSSVGPLPINGFHDELAPPSTYAARLVKNHSEGIQRHKSEHGLPIDELIQEIVHGDGPRETNLDTNYKLVDLMVKYGIDAVQEQNPLADTSKLIARAKNCITVIEETIRRQPMLLFHPISLTTPMQQKGFMVEWLLARLLRFCAYEPRSGLRDDIVFLLARMSEVLLPSVVFWQQARSILCMFTDTADDVFWAIDEFQCEPRNEAKAVQVTVPPVRSVLRLTSQAQASLVAGGGTHFNIDALSPALNVLTAILAAVSQSAVSTISVGNRHEWLHRTTSRAIGVMLRSRSALEEEGSFHDMADHILGLIALATTSRRLAEPHDMSFVFDSSRPFILAHLQRPFHASAQSTLAQIVDWITRHGAHMADDVEFLCKTLPHGVEHAIRRNSQDDLQAALGRFFTMQHANRGDADSEGDIHMRHVGQAANDMLYHKASNNGPVSTTSRSSSDRTLLEMALQDLIAYLHPGTSEVSVLDELSAISFDDIGEHEQKRLWRLLGTLPCLATVSVVDTEGCKICSNNPRLITDAASCDWQMPQQAVISPEKVLKIIKSFLNTASVRASVYQQCLAAVAIRNFLLHVQDTAWLTLEDSDLARWALQSLSNSSRQLRFLAGEILMTMLREGIQPDVSNRNRRHALSYFREVSALNDPFFDETLIRIWARIAVICTGDAERNLVLLELVQYLGHRSTYTSAMAYCEIEQICEVLDLLPSQLFWPYWKSIASCVVRDVLAIPQKIQSLSEILNMSVDEFLITTQTHTLPYLVGSKKQNVLQRIADACGPNATPASLILDNPSNRAAVLAALFLRLHDDPETYAAAVLSEVVPGTTTQALYHLVNTDPAATLVELLKAAADERGNPDAPSRKALSNFVEVCVSRSGAVSRVVKRVIKSPHDFWQENILGIMTSFSNIIEHVPQKFESWKGHGIIQDKIRCLHAIEELTTLTGLVLSTVIPQIRACLQSAIDQGGLSDPAISAWLSLMKQVDEDDVLTLLDHLLTIIVQKWTELSPVVQQRSYDTVAFLLKHHNQAIREQVIMIPSMSGIPLLGKFAEEIKRLKSNASPQAMLEAFVTRLQDENSCIVLQAARELEEWLESNQSFVQESANRDPPLAAVPAMLRILLDVCVKYNLEKPDIACKAGKCLGIIGCVDPNRIEANVSDKQVILLSNFENLRECYAWIVSLFQDVLIPAFESSVNARAQGFLAFAMQELIIFAKFENNDANRLRSSQSNPANEAWSHMSEHAKNMLAPFFTSHYVLTTNTAHKPAIYPIWQRRKAHSEWLRTWVHDMLCHGRGENATLIFGILGRLVFRHDMAIARFLLPYVALNIVLTGKSTIVDHVAQEIMIVLSSESSIPAEIEVLKQCSQDVFAILDYMTRWAQEKKQAMASSRLLLMRAGHPIDEAEENINFGRIQTVEAIVTSIPADIIAQRAIQCGSYHRALFHWENFIREQQQRTSLTMNDKDQALARLQAIYGEIDEPDGLEGITAHMTLVSPEQVALQNLQAGRFSAARTWYEIEFAEHSEKFETQIGLLSCLHRSGYQNEVLRVGNDILQNTPKDLAATDRGQEIACFVAEAAWSTGNIDKVQHLLNHIHHDQSSTPFNVSVALTLERISKMQIDDIDKLIESSRSNVTRSLSKANTSSLSACHSQLLQLHILYELGKLKYLAGTNATKEVYTSLSSVLEDRLGMLGASTADKQLVLSVRRAALQAASLPLREEIGRNWLETASLARKAGNMTTAHIAVLSAVKCGISMAKIEQARLMWHGGQHRQATLALEGALAGDTFSGDAQSLHPTDGSRHDRNMPQARARILLAKWLDSSGQTSYEDVRRGFQNATSDYKTWDKGHYYLGKHYNKLLEAEKSKPSAKQSLACQSGEITKVIIENYLRSLPWGTKYWYQTIPKLLTLWLDLGMDCSSKPKDVSTEVFESRRTMLAQVNAQMKKYFDRTATYGFYTALAQMLSRVSHPHPKVAELLSAFIVRIAATYPAQSLWSLLPVSRATSTDRAARGKEIIAKLREKKISKSENASLELKSLIMQGQKLQDGLLNACDIHLEGRTSAASLARDLNFNHKLAPNPLVIPFQHFLIPNIPILYSVDEVRKHRPFVQDKVTIAALSDDVLVLNSLQRPRKLTIRGSDGDSYGLLCKPKDDLRKDQRLMEFNTMINRALKRDPETLKRRLYIKTYAVTPLSEESGAIEWVEGIKPIRDILLGLYKRRGITPNYTDIRHILNEASSHESKHHLFTDKLLPQFPPVLYEYFTDLFPSSSAWFAARLRYARTNAVMSMVGHVLGLGDRHGENILLEESTGAVFHVDFNCLFDKGLTFEKPELVPFRLTHNMVDAMGPALGVEGPYRRSAELVLARMRVHHDTLMNVLETFLHDPTADFIGTAAKKKRAAAAAAAAAAQHGSLLAQVPDTPREVLDNVSGKVRGFLAGNSLPLAVEGHVQTLIAMATDEANLCRMYIGWCAFF